ncbi:MAG: hypothetical protein ACYC4R_12510 [Anaerolineae bacterium]
MMNLGKYPDTLNLAGRAALAIRALVELRDQELGGLIYFNARYDLDPPTAFHNAWDYGDGTGRHVDALVLAHIMTGSQEALATAQELAGLLCSWQGEKGLLWWPQEPWLSPDADNMAWWTLPDWKPGEHVAETAWSQRGALMGFTSLYLLTGQDSYHERARAIVDGLDAVALAKEDYRFFPEFGYRVGGWRDTAEPRTDGTSEWHGIHILPLLRFYEATGYEPASRLASGLVRFILHRGEGYELDGSFHKTKLFWAHFHSKVAVITGIIRYGLLTRQPEYVAWGRQAYEAAKAWGTEFGWFRENLNNPRRCETCCITDMIEAALLLGLHVDADYLTEAERYGRNHLVESQFTSLEWAERVPRRPAAPLLSQYDARRMSQERVLERSLGSFAGWSAPNDLFDEGAFDLMQCCNGAGTRALYDLWHHAVDDDGARARVHMAFSRPTAWGDVISFLPYLGRVDIQLKAERTLHVRIPPSVARSVVQVMVNEAPAQASWERSYVCIEGLQAGDVASVRYPLPLHTRTYTSGEDVYLAAYKGDTLTAITPRGRYAPLYQRDHYLLDVAPETEAFALQPGSEIASL